MTPITRSGPGATMNALRPLASPPLPQQVSMGAPVLVWMGMVIHGLPSCAVERHALHEQAAP